ncbi:hypothetical protein [Noviherbaspirillum sp. UKPF54]|uniref:hypothetical protein n=1 Tax=Noviherbaspirillum sp. UKPF54 TaxID=2601898 RepID=UPI0011B19045|nr:hypothetical protein [Noviherbaspirillum sp. UKPF54]QDZ27002.1 hypothetical protein FAY22_02900 [Noviherbaspirillum sp. UKPF54]
MKSSRKLVSAMLIVMGGMLVLPPAAQAARSTEERAEAQQSREDMSPQGQYKIAKKEADAAYREALTNCKKMGKADRVACMKDAKANYQSDLAQAKKEMSSGR